MCALTFMAPLLGLIENGEVIIIALIALACGAVIARSNGPRADLRRIERKLDALLQHQGVPPPQRLSKEVQLMACDPTRRIEAVKLHREQTGLGLADAKPDIEEFIKTYIML